MNIISVVIIIVPQIQLLVHDPVIFLPHIGNEICVKFGTCFKLGYHLSIILPSARVSECVYLKNRIDNKGEGDGGDGTVASTTWVCARKTD